VKSRPLTHVPVDDEQEAPLTPNDLLKGVANLPDTPGLDAELSMDSSTRKQWRVARMLRHRVPAYACAPREVVPKNGAHPIKTSSAYISTCECFITKGRSLVNKVKRSGPRWLPCGTLDVTRRIQDRKFLKRTCCFLPFLVLVFLIEGND